MAGGDNQVVVGSAERRSAARRKVALAALAAVTIGACTYRVQDIDEGTAELLKPWPTRAPPVPKLVVPTFGPPPTATPTIRTIVPTGTPLPAPVIRPTLAAPTLVPSPIAPTPVPSPPAMPSPTFAPPPTATFTISPTATLTPAPTETAAPPPTATSTASPTATLVPSATATFTATSTATFTPSPTPTPSPSPSPAIRTPLASRWFRIPLASLSEMESLGEKPEITALVEAARANPTAPIHIAAYAAEEDAIEQDTSVKKVSESLVIDLGSYLVGRGIDPERLSGKGMGADATIGRAIIVTFERPPPSRKKRAASR